MVGIWGILEPIGAWAASGPPSRSLESYRIYNGSFLRVTIRVSKGSFKGLYKGLEFPTIRGTLFGGPYNKDPTV